ncbi:MAG: ABC transporter ATP-binding protein/permease [Defluviitaleaceae bacterium]|nr:ABC transporter ATP-binding protein/permease [Defluviitaleaceae bacterium]
MRKKAKLYKITSKIVFYAFQSSSKSMSILILVAVLLAVIGGINILVTENVFNSVASISQDNTFKRAILSILLFLVVMLSQEVLNGILNYKTEVMNLRIKSFLSQKIIKKIDSLDLLYFENPENLDKLNKSKIGLEYAFSLALTMIMIVIFYGLFWFITAWYLYLLNPILILAVVFIFIPKLVTVLSKASIYANLEERTAPLRRESLAYYDAIVSRDFFKETRLLGAYSFFKEKFLTTLLIWNKEIWKVNVKTTTFEVFMSVLTAIGYIGTLYLLYLSLRQGSITIGAFAAVFNNIAFLVSSMNEMICERLGYANEMVGKVTNFVQFIEESEPTLNKENINWKEDIVLKNISFRYPNTEKNVFSNINLTIKVGETLAIVGENGAGKSTLTKVLIGLYKPIDGNIIVGNQSIQEIDKKNLYDGVSALFQKFQKYQMTLKENVEISSDYSNYNVLQTIKKVGIDLTSKAYPNKEDTMLSLEFDGIDISGGQWQRVAIARSIYRYHDIIILDEPTSAIDPIEESSLYNLFAEIAVDKTAIIVTHRLGLTKIADRIIVMDKGNIVEIGTHQELLKQNRLYASMYKSQSDLYNV